MINDFIFQKGLWLGEGKITLSTAKESIRFYTKWEILSLSAGVIEAIQTVEMQGIGENVVNEYRFFDLTSSHFSVEVKNQMVEYARGRGIRNAATIAWEFPIESALHGFEVYELQKDGDFSFHAEYGGKGDFSSVIDGLIWKKKEG